MLKLVIVDGGWLHHSVVEAVSRKYEKEKRNPFHRSRQEAYATFIGSLCSEVASHLDKESSMHRILYYDCKPFGQRIKLPISQEETDKYTTKSDGWLNKIGSLENFALRLGQLKSRGFSLKENALKKIKSGEAIELTDNDFKPEFEQKGVDMRIGLDIASYSTQENVNEICIITNDTDIVPAMKLARRNGKIISCVIFTQGKEQLSILSELMKQHCDRIIKVDVDALLRREPLSQILEKWNHTG